MHHRLARAVATAVIGLAGAASAQTLPHRDDPTWEPIGADGARYAILPALTSQAHATVLLTLKATVAPASDGTPNTVVARVTVDCERSEIGVVTSEFYNETQRFLRTVEGPEHPPLKPATEPGQLLVVRHMCAAE
ncbi:hypothetical protein [Brevundimonas sp. Root1279]|uniref:hypothetical protein n=1 Tax=Brevundimonas sp. Root1279 TaxID=1736443 RepID=UPI0006F3E181|nr:hypothetical protein [Brevundimonas sp. Root1279]KQW82603.1 hypothetical protein ASC65_10330 [Brevundimonas sp. Root1279]